MSQEIDSLAVMPKLVSLSLVESATTHASQTGEYRVTTILELLLEPLLSEEEWQTTRQRAARKIYQVWWEESEEHREEQGLEIVRLGLLAGEQEIAVSVGHRIANRWLKTSRFLEIGQLCEPLLKKFVDYRILGTIAAVETFLGKVEDAVAHYQQALKLCPEADLEVKAAILSNMARVIAQQGDIERAIALWEQSLEIAERINGVGGKATTLNDMAWFIAQQGDIERAIALWQQCLEIYERIGDVGGKAVILNNMAGVIAQQGDIERAIALWQQCLEIYERIGDVGGKALTQANLAYWAGETGDKAKQLDLNLQAASAFAQVRAYGYLVTVLSNLGLADDNGLVYLAQAIWLTLRIQTPLADTIAVNYALYHAVPQGDELEALLGITAAFFCNLGGEGHPQLEKLQELSVTMLSAAAGARGIETQEAFETWFFQQRLDDPEYFLPRLIQRLEEIVGDEWLFDRSQVS
jgi:tetratricopeptide (TPR) repeat protein